MRAVVLLAALAASAAHAELYRWIDPETGSVKYSTAPPQDSRVNAQVVPYKAPPAQPPQAGALEALEARWLDLLSQLSVLAPRDFRLAGDGLKRQIEAYGTLTAELDRIDPAGIERRRTQSEGMLERLKRGLTPQPGQSKK